MATQDQEDKLPQDIIRDQVAILLAQNEALYEEKEEWIEKHDELKKAIEDIESIVIQHT